MLSRLVALMLLAVLINGSMAALATTGSRQQGEPQAESEEGFTATLNGDGFTTRDIITVSAATTTTDATRGSNNTSTGSATTIINVTAINQSTIEAIDYTEQAYAAMQNNNTQNVFRNLNLTLDALESVQGNLTLATPQGSSSNINISNNTSVGKTRVSIVLSAQFLTDTAFQPNPINVSFVPGTVTWVNDDTVPHSVTSGENGQANGKFDSSIMGPEETFSFEFTEAGVYPYFCILHPNMVGTVQVG